MSLVIPAKAGIHVSLVIPAKAGIHVSLVIPAKAGIHVSFVIPAKAGIHVSLVIPAKAGIHVIDLWMRCYHEPGRQQMDSRGADAFAPYSGNDESGELSRTRRVTEPCYHQIPSLTSIP